MDVFKPIVKHSLIVIVLWIIVIGLSAPLFLKLDEVTEYRAERLMPNTTESMRANELLSEIMSEKGGRAASLAYDVIIVTGVNTSDPKLVDIDREIEGNLSSYVDEYTSPYKIVREVYSDLKENMSSMLNETYSYLNTTYHMLDMMQKHSGEIIDGIKMMHEMITMLDEYYRNVSSNKTFYLNLSKTMYRNLTSFKELYINMSSEYNETVKNIRGLKGLIELTKYMLIAGDEYYSYTLANLSSMYMNLTIYNTTIYYLNDIYYNVGRQYLDTLYDVIRIHYYLYYNTTAYRDGLNDTVIDQVVNYTCLSSYCVDRGMVSKVYDLVVNNYGLNNTNTSTLYYIARDIMEEEITSMPMIEQYMAQPYIQVLTNVFLNKTLEEMVLENITGLYEILFNDSLNGQTQLLVFLNNTYREIFPETIYLYADTMVLQIINMMGLPSQAHDPLYYVFINTYYAGHPLKESVLEDLVVGSMYNLTLVFTNMSLYNTSMTLFHGLYRYGPVREVVVNSTHVFLYEAFPMGPPPIHELVWREIVVNDTSGNHIYGSNTSLAEIVATRIVSNFTTLPFNILYSFYRGVIDEYETAHLIMKTMIVKYSGSEELGVVVDIIYRYNGSVLYDGFREIFTTMFTEFSMEGLFSGFGGDGFTTGFMNQSIDLTLLADHLAEMIWENRVDEEYVYRFILGAPLVFMAIGMSNNTGYIDEILYHTEIINTIVNNNTYSDPEILIDSITYVFNLTGSTANLFPIEMPSNISFNIEPLLRNLIELPRNASDNQLARAMIDSMVESFTVEMPSVEGFEINTSVVEDVFYKVLMNQTTPIDALIDMASENGMEFNSDAYKEYLRESIENNDPEIFINGVLEIIYNDLFENITDGLEGIMISSEYGGYMISISPKGSGGEEKGRNALKARDIVLRVLRDNGYNPEYVGVTGDDILGMEMKEYSGRDIENVNRISMITPVIIALVLLGGILATGLPFLGIASSIIVSSAILYILAYLGIIDVVTWSRMLLITTAFGLGMDYSTYIVLRFKERLPVIKDPVETAYDAVKYALPAIMAAATTDIIGFAVMSLAWEFPLIASIGETVPIAIAVVLLVSLTFTPAILAKLGNKKWFWWPHRLEKGRAGWRGFKITRGRAYGLVFLSIILLVFGLQGFMGFKGSHDYSVFMPENTAGYKGYMKLQEIFPAGKLMPIYIVVVLKDNYSVYDEVVSKEIDKLCEKIKSVEDVSEVYGPTNPGDKSSDFYVSSDNKTFYLEVIIKPSPLSREGIDLTKEIRDLVKKHDFPYAEELLVGGFSASSAEMEELLNNIFWKRVFPVAFILMWIAMSLSFMSVWSGLIALATIIIGYLFGISMVSTIADIYGQPTLWFLPLLCLPAVLGVGMDYNSFYMNRQRYELMKNDAGDGYTASTRAIHTISHLVLGLGLIVTSTYASLLIGSSWGIRELGTALSTSVFVTTILSAFILTPAILAILGPKAWWPGSKRWRKK